MSITLIIRVPRKYRLYKSCISYFLTDFMIHSTFASIVCFTFQYSECSKVKGSSMKFEFNLVHAKGFAMFHRFEYQQFSKTARHPKQTTTKFHRERWQPSSPKNVGATDKTRNQRHGIASLIGRSPATTVSDGPHLRSTNEQKKKT